jgi:hypothetical protein
LRLFSEASTADNNPLFNLGTASTGNNGTLDFFFRQTPWATVDHLRSLTEPLDGTWHHIVFVQRDDGTRDLYVDGTPDGVVIPAKEAGAWNVNTTTLGGILRANATHFLNGTLDDVALWNRALSPAEIQTVATTGIPPFTPPAPPPLAVRSFKADLPAVVSGGSVVLRWDVTKNAQVTIDQGVGDVTGDTISGLGAVEVTPNGTRTYTLTLTRAGEAPATAQTTVTVIDQVQPGWVLLDNFDRYEPGPIADGGVWFDLAAPRVVITNWNGNLVATPAGPSVVAVLKLNDLTIQEGEQRTLFCRMVVTDDFTDWNAVVGLTDRPLRFGTDIDGTDIGPAIYTFPDAWPGFLAAANGAGAAVDASSVANPPSIEDNTGVAWNIWIDVTNGPFTPGDPNPIDTGDRFTVYVQKDGDAAPRTAIFTDYMSSRNPVGAADVGFTQPYLNSVIIGGRNAGAYPQDTNQQILIDDLYLSTGGFNASIPRPFGYSEPVTAADPPVMSVGRSGANLQINWDYGVLESASTVDGSYTPVQGASAPSHTVTPAGQQMFYRVNGN